MMTLFSPFNDIRRFHREFENHRTRDFGDGQGADFRPAVDIEENEEHVLIRADLPGVKQDDIEVKVHDGVLLLSGKRESLRDDKAEGRYYSERTHGSFFRKFRLGRQVDPEKIQATFKDGVLTVELSKRAELQPRQIKVVTE